MHTSWATGVCRVSTLPLLARTLGVNVEELIGEDAIEARKRGRAPKLQHTWSASARYPSRANAR